MELFKKFKLFGARERVLHRVCTDYNDITVTRRGNIITLWSPSKIRQTSVDVTDPLRPCLEYTRHCLLSLVFCPEPASILVLGLGGGAVPMMLYHLCPQVHIDVVELDPEVPVLAEKYFHFSTGNRVRLHVDDAALYIQRKKKKYDMIFMDAYLGHHQTLPVTTHAFYTEVRERLTDRGVLVANLLTGNRSRFRKITRRIGSLFEHFWILPGDSAANALGFACKQMISRFQLQLNLNLWESRIPMDYHLESLVERVYQYVPPSPLEAARDLEA